MVSYESSGRGVVKRKVYENVETDIPDLADSR